LPEIDGRVEHLDIHAKLVHMTEPRGDVLHVAVGLADLGQAGELELGPPRVVILAGGGWPQPAVDGDVALALGGSHAEGREPRLALVREGPGLFALDDVTIGVNYGHYPPT